MADAKKVLQDLIDNLNKEITETEGILQAQQGCLVTLKKQRNYIVAKKKGIEEEEKREAEEKAKEQAPPKVKRQRGKKGAQTPTE